MMMSATNSKSWIAGVIQLFTGLALRHSANAGPSRSIGVFACRNAIAILRTCAASKSSSVVCFMAGAFLGLLWNSQCKATPAAIVALAAVGGVGQGV